MNKLGTQLTFTNSFPLIFVKSANQYVNNFNGYYVSK